MEPSIIESLMKLHRCCELMQRDVDRQVRMSDTQCAFLQAMPDAQVIHSGELCRRVGLSPSRGSRVIDELVRAGLAFRQAHDQDRRVTLVGLTSDGQLRREQVGAMLASCETSITQRLDPQKLATVREALALLLKAMETV